MNQRQLEIFTSLAENLSFTKTAEQLYLSQTTVTLQIHSLEEELQARLFDRTSRSVHLTYAGTVFYKSAVEILKAMRYAADQTTLAAKEYSGQLRIGFADDVNATGLSGLIRSFLSDHPEIHLEISGGYPGDLLASLLSDQFDLIFSPSYHGLKNTRLNQHVIGRYQTIAAFRRDHPFAKKKALKFTDFSQQDYIHVSGKDEELEFASEFLHQMEAHNIRLNIMQRTDNIDTVFLMIDAGLGFTVIPEYFAGRLFGTSQIRTCRIDESLKATEFLALWKPGQHTKEMAAFIRAVKEYFVL